MPILTTCLPDYGFLDNLPDVVFSEIISTASVSVKFNGEALLTDVKMEPDAKGRITIYAKQMIRNMVTLTKPKSCTLELPQLIVQISIAGWGALSTSGYVIPGSTNAHDAITPEWFTENFLTWQPQIMETTRTQPQWLAFIPVPSFDHYEIQSTLYTKDGRTFTQTVYNIPRGSNFQQFRTDFVYLWEKHCITHNLYPYCYDVFGKGYKVPPSNNATELETAREKGKQTVAVNKPFAQRYILRNNRYNDICFGFENTLGAFDTLMLEGKQTYQPEGDISTFRTHTSVKELINDYTSIWEANTGRLETERTANQFQDFLKSTNRHVLRNGRWFQIIVTEYKIKHYLGESNSYSFKYHLANKNEGRYFNRAELPNVKLPNDF